MTHSFTCPQGKKTVSESGSQENEGLKKDDLLNVCKYPEFLSKIIAERKMQIESSKQSIHVNPKFLGLNTQNLEDCVDGLQAPCAGVKSHFQCTSQGFRHSKQLEQDKNLAGSLSIVSRNRNLAAAANSVEEANKCLNYRKSMFVNKIAFSPSKNIVKNSDVNQSANVIFRNFQPKSVYINPNFTKPRHALVVNSGSMGTHPDVSNKATTSVHINPRFARGVESQLLKEKGSNSSNDPQMGNMHSACTQATLVDRGSKCVYVNPEFAAAKRVCKDHISSGVPNLSLEEKKLLVDKNLNSVFELNSACDTLELPKTKVNLNVSVPPRDRKNSTAVSHNSARKVKTIKNTLRAPSIVHVTSASKIVRRNSLVLLSKTKLIRRNVRGDSRRTCEEQPTVAVSSSCRRLVKRSPSWCSKLTKGVGPQSGMKPSPRLVFRSSGVKVAKSQTTKYKYVRNLSTPDKAQNVLAKKRLDLSLPKLPKHNSSSSNSSSVTSEEKQTGNLSLKRNVPQNSLIVLSKTKLIRRGTKFTVRKNSRDHQTVTISNNARKLVRRRRSSQSMSPRQRTSSLSSTVKLTPRAVPPPSVVKVARSVRTKYKYIRSLSDQKNKRAIRGTPLFSSRSRFCLESKYNFDRRAMPISRGVRKIRKYCVNYPRERTWLRATRATSLSYRNRSALLRLSARKTMPSSLVWRNENYYRKKRAASYNRRLQRTNRRSKSSENKRCGGASNMVQIGGVLYRRSVNKLTRTNTGGVGTTAEAGANKVASRQGHILHIRGSKFLMEPTGRTMRRIDAPSVHAARTRKDKVEAPITRIDIGGVTFLQKSQNVLIRTDYHRARNILSQAKQRSIATLMLKCKKNNQPCVFYQRFGKCLRKEKGTCPRVHDPKQIALCKKFLQGSCHVADCPLSHNVVPEKMATCRFFLEGICIRDNCPYLHVKLNSKAGICVGFLQGYCAAGDKCQKRHTNLCPEFDRLGKCSRGKFCPYPHKVGVKRRAKKRELPKSSAVVRSKDTASVKSVAHRYYEDPCTSKSSDAAEKAEEEREETDAQCLAEESRVVDVPDELVVTSKRRKLEPMPHYIAFT